MNKKQNQKIFQKSSYFCQCVNKKVRAKYIKTIRPVKLYTVHRLECPYCNTCFITWSDFK